MFGADRGIIEPGRDGMSQLDLAFFVGEQKSFRALQNTEPSTLKTRGVLSGANSLTTGLDADHSHLSILQKGMEQTDGVAAATDTRDEQIGEAVFGVENLGTR